MADVSGALSDARPTNPPAPATRPRTTVAWTFGVVLPIICFVFDPIVFTEASYARFAVGAYLLAAIAIGALILSLTGSGRAGDHSFVRGVLFSAGIFALVVGIVILPLAVLGILFVGIGLFGLVPFGTAYVYLRRGWPGRLAAARSLRGVGWFLAGMIAPAAIVGAVQFLATNHVEHAMQLALSPSEAEQQRGIEGVRHAFWCGSACLYWTYFGQGQIEDYPLFERAFREAAGETFDQWRSRNILVATSDD
jgi:MFS family permease